jgi:Tfp pilus assembly protein PilV
VKILDLKQAGDTMVEVAICLTISVAALVAGMISANQSIHNTRQSQERSEAVKIAQQQIEQSKAFSKTLPQNYCLNNDTLITWTSSTPTPPQDYSVDNFANYPDGCKPNDSPGIYHIWINNQDRANGIVLLTVTVRWPKVGTGNGVNQVQLVATKIISGTMRGL